MTTVIIPFLIYCLILIINSKIILQLIIERIIIVSRILSLDVAIPMPIKSTFLIIVALVFFSVCVAQQLKTESFNVFSQQVKDSFTVRVSFPSSFNYTGPYSSVYYLDADIKSGNDLRNLLADTAINSRLEKTLFIGIAQKGRHQKFKYPKLRSRDFIPPINRQGKIVTSTKAYKAHADNFYKFLTAELIPLIHKRFNVNSSRTLIGHSLGGLFVFYCLFKNEHLFKNYFALSPALWVHQYNIFMYEQQYHLTNDQMNMYLYISSGSRETMNHILKGARRMKKLLEQRHYKGLRFEYYEHKGKTHFTQVPVSLSYILTHADF